MGDSYQSGVGAGDYDPLTDIGGTNECLRSRNAYASLLAADNTIPYRLDFVACSGARIAHLYQTRPSRTARRGTRTRRSSHLDDGPRSRRSGSAATTSTSAR